MANKLKMDENNTNFINYKMIEYIREITPMENGALGELQRDCYEEGLPIIPPETVSLLRTILTMKHPSKILEIGCAAGFSSALMASFLPNDGHITTIDRYPYMIDKARSNFSKLNLNNKITLLEGDAAEILPLLNGSFDMIFMDAAKAQYLQFLPDCLRLLENGGILVCDDVLHDGTVSENRFSVPRRQRTAHRRMRAFLWLISNAEGLETTILTVGGGVSVSVKTNDDVLLKGYDINDF